MSNLPVIAIYDIGKTNKKLFLFDEDYKVVMEQSVQLEETKDEDGFPCEDLAALSAWVKDSFSKAISIKNISVKAVNFSAYGASLVHIDKKGVPLTPLYNYLKPFPENLQKQFYEQYGGKKAFSLLTASPALGNLNAGLQLYRLKNEQPGLFKKIHRSLHLPQYLSRLITGKNYSDITSIGCHTGLWNFNKKDYHEWVYQEGIIDKLAPVFPSDHVSEIQWNNFSLSAGIGLHDSSAALIPYLSCFDETFMLLSTGTWCISLNPFNQVPLRSEELDKDCLCYMDYRGNPIKASRLFAGYEYDQQVKKMAAYFQKTENYFQKIEFNPAIASMLSPGNSLNSKDITSMYNQPAFNRENLAGVPDEEIAYHQMVFNIIQQQVNSTNLVLKDCPVKKIFAAGGFSRNSVYMHFLAMAYPQSEVYASGAGNASAMGAALVIHSQWNKKNIPVGIIELRQFVAHS